MNKLKRLQTGLLPHRLAILQTVLLLLGSFLIFTSQASAVIRFSNRSLFISDPSPGATTTYKVALTYTTQTTVGSLDMLFCNDPIPTDPCDPPAGLDVSGAVLASQTGVTGYTILTQTANHIVITRTPGVVANIPATYSFSNIVNPSDTSQSFSIRLSDYASTDASGPIIDLGSIVSQSSKGVSLEAQVPPILVFCVGQIVNQDCNSTNGINYTNLGTLSSSNTLTATSQMAAGTNASGGYVITANGPTMEAGNHVINALASPTLSAPGNSQFGMNLVGNSSPAVGSDPDGPFANALPAADYGVPNQFTYRDGDVVASAPNVSLVRRFTVSYIVNVPPNLRAGVYTTTITYLCTGRF